MLLGGPGAPLILPLAVDDDDDVLLPDNRLADSPGWTLYPDGRCGTCRLVILVVTRLLPF